MENNKIATEQDLSQEVSVDETKANSPIIANEDFLNSTDTVDESNPSKVVQEVGGVITPDESPLSLGERFMLSFANEQGEYEYLRQKFPKSSIEYREPKWWEPGRRKALIDGVPIDSPVYKINDLPADVAELIPEAIRMYSQIQGSTLGAAAGAPVGGITSGPAGVVGGSVSGAIVGGILGRNLGNELVRAIGNYYGVRKEDATDIALDMIKTSSEGAVGEASALALKPLSDSFVKTVQNSARKIQQNVAEKGFRKTVASLQNVNENVIKHLQTKGVSNVLTKETLDENASANIAKDIYSKFSSERTKYLSSLKTAREELMSDVSGKEILSGKEVESLIKKEFFNRGWSDENGVLTEHFPKTDDAIYLKNLLEQIKTRTSNGFSVRDVVPTIDRINDMVDFGKKGNYPITSAGEGILKKVASLYDNALSLKFPKYKALKQEAKINFFDPTNALFGSTDKVTPEALEAIVNSYGKSGVKVIKQENIDGFIKGMYGSDAKNMTSKMYDTYVARIMRDEATRGSKVYIGGLLGGAIGAGLGSLAGGAGGAIYGGAAGAVAGRTLSLGLSTPAITTSVMRMGQALAKGASTKIHGTYRGLEQVVPRLSNTSLRDFFEGKKSGGA